MATEPRATGELSDARRALLQRYLRGASRPNESKDVAIPRRTETGPAPLSYSQQQIWLHAQLAGDALIYNEPVTIRRRGKLDRAALERSLTEIIRRHEAWRTTFTWEGERGVQLVQSAPEHIAIPFVELRADQENEAIRLATEDARQPFDLTRGPLYRLRLISLGKNDHRLYLTLHHIIFDGVSLYRVLLPELLACYAAFSRSESPALAELPVQYPDFAAWQRAPANETAAEQVEYWRTICADAPVLDLPTDRPRPPVQSYRGAVEQFAIPPAIAADLKALSQEQGATPFMTMMAAFMTLLRGWSGQKDIVLGSISSGRRHNETMGLLGCFLNTVPIRCAFPDDPSFIELLARVRQATLGALSHDEVPFELLVQKFGRRDASRAPLVQALLVLEPPLEPLPESWGFTHMDVDPGTAKFDLQLGLDDRAEGLAGRFIYNTDLFDRATIVELGARWLQLLDRIVAAPKQRLSELTASPSRAPLAEWNATRTDYPRDAAIHQLFEAEVRKTPAAIALVFGETQWSYDQLNRRANRLADRLRKLGVTRDRPVGVCLERSPEMIVALLAVLKAGGACVPLDHSYPSGRLAFFIAETEPPVILTQTHLQKSLTAGRQLICLDAEDCAAEDESNLASEVHAEDLACIIYTSGSTGTPKGVAVPHRAVVRLVRATNYATFGPNETFLQLAPISFDASIFEIWGALLNGGRLVLLPPAPPSLEDIGRAIRDHGVTTLWLTSALFNAMVDERLDDLRPLRQLLAGGDVLSVAHVRKALGGLPETRLINGYGPTESTTFACCHTIAPDAPLAGPIPIGRPIANTTAFVLDANLQPTAVGIEGELHLGGDGLARGYWRRADLTAEKFIPDPFSTEPGARLYKTGDRARWRADGVIEFLGRADNQIKLRGFRIEPGELEAALQRQPGVREAAVLLRETAPNEKLLVAYVVGQGIDQAAVLAGLRTTLPDYMIPSAIVALSVMPRTPNGKCDRAALPAPPMVQPSVAPRVGLEEKLALIWAGVLGLERVGRTDNFFDLGGHSLAGLRLLNRVQEELGRPAPLAMIFEAPTVAAMAAWLEEKKSSTGKHPLAPIVPVNREFRRVRRG